MFSVAIKLVKYVVHSSKRGKMRRNYFSSQVAQTLNDQFLVSRNSRDSRNFRGSYPDRIDSFSRD
jgi:hypothetical protein